MVHFITKLNLVLLLEHPILTPEGWLTLFTWWLKQQYSTSNITLKKNNFSPTNTQYYSLVHLFNNSEKEHQCLSAEQMFKRGARNGCGKTQW